MRTESKNRLITRNGKQLQVTLHRGKGDSWFMHREEAEQHRVGHTGMQALDIILGVDGAFHRLPLTHRFVDNNRIPSAALRRWLNTSCG